MIPSVPSLSPLIFHFLCGAVVSKTTRRLLLPSMSCLSYTSNSEQLRWYSDELEAGATGSGAQLASYQMSTVGSFPGGKAAGT
jgi:hypothetical protein